MNATRYLPFAGRLLIGLPFAMSGLSKLAAISPTTEMIRAAGLPLPSLALAVAVVVELGGGLLLASGFAEGSLRSPTGSQSACRRTRAPTSSCERCGSIPRSESAPTPTTPRRSWPFIGFELLPG